jgi:SET domain
MSYRKRSSRIIVDSSDDEEKPLVKIESTPPTLVKAHSQSYNASPKRVLFWASQATHRETTSGVFSTFKEKLDDDEAVKQEDNEAVKQEDTAIVQCLEGWLSEDKENSIPTSSDNNESEEKEHFMRRSLCTTNRWRDEMAAHRQRARDKMLTEFEPDLSGLMKTPQLEREFVWTPPSEYSGEKKFALITAMNSYAIGKNGCPAPWPHDIIHLHDYYNPGRIEFKPATQGFSWCGCHDRCNSLTCTNGQLGVYCTARTCPFEGLCGNGINTHPAIQLYVNPHTEGYAVVALKDIEKGEIICEYLGELCLSTPGLPLSSDQGTTRNKRVYIMEMAVKTKNDKATVYIDAETKGNISRFFNHACDATAKFYEMAKGPRHTVVVMSTRYIKLGEEITVNYGQDLWFYYRCGSPNCVHRDLPSNKRASA